MGPERTNLIDSVFAGSGEMAHAMRALDWSATPLGPVEQWPQALRTIVRVVLGSGYPMAICWGPDYVLLYNDAYRADNGNKAPVGAGSQCPRGVSRGMGFHRADVRVRDGSGSERQLSVRCASRHLPETTISKRSTSHFLLVRFGMTTGA